MKDFDQRFTDTFRSTFGDEGIVLEDSMTADDIEAWDSISHISLVFTVEEEFGIRLSMDDLETLENVGDLRRVVLRQLQAS